MFLDVFFSVICHFKGSREKGDVDVGTWPNRFGFCDSPSRKPRLQTLDEGKEAEKGD